MSSVDRNDFNIEDLASVEATLSISNYVRAFILAIVYGVGVALTWSLASQLQIADYLYCDRDYDSECTAVIPEALAGLAVLWALFYGLALLILIIGVIHIRSAYQSATEFRELAELTVTTE